MVSKLVRQAHNAWSVKYFAIATGSIMCLFIIYHWVNLLHLKYGSRSHGKWTAAFTRSHRATKRYLTGTIFSLCVGRWGLYIIYWAVNLILTLTNMEYELKYAAKRLGWISVANFVLLVFLALRNTPLAPLSGNSYEKLRPLHKTAGYTCIVTSVIHGITYVASWAQTGNLYKFNELEYFAGAIAGLAMIVIGLSTITWVVRRSYEAFYFIHLALFLLIIIMIGLHRPKISKQSVVIIIFTACMWGLDRLVRLAKICWNLYGNHAVITTVPDGAVRVKLNRNLNCKPGSHAFLWIPSLRLFESHPFTLISNEPVEFLIRPYDGFTSDLFKVAQKQPGQRLRCSLDGAYGQVPSFMDFDSVVLVAGGSGASFTFAIALDLVKQLKKTGSNKRIDFMWAVKSEESLEWFGKELQELRESKKINLHIYVTQGDLEKSIEVESLHAAGDSSSASSVQDPEKGFNANEPSASLPPMLTRKGRPDIEAHLASFIDACAPESRVGVGACGPANMLGITRKALSHSNYDNGPSITFHTEEFEW
ncbi:unnamed protein product [Penicillium salamii]|uniref:FAD-binding FR-type domain-containing protein n=1 Tax=Penicillium salamii TaxID=1612424 RepID=A0A9W4JAZ7_9EURO|nr:unnamed protein product [Penicillium salamii]CAG7987324.1 unnamed protein product [Penicillium salamii]CAG8277162.1 unnamed protein product [Penicillium salamii]CAG8352507.1 unnamed protein product [Penicillium salamii]CAG8356482.1 unnamed protein product [Penicillium salamii]